MIANILKNIDRLSIFCGKAVAWLIPVLILELVYDTLARYVFNAPTFWSYDVSYMLYGTIFMIGAAYTLFRDEHVRIEVIYDKASARTKALIDVVGYIVFFFPSLIALLYFGSGFAFKSFKMLESSGESMWGPPIYPFKAVIPLAAILLLLQGIAQFLRSMGTLFERNGK